MWAIMTNHGTTLDADCVAKPILVHPVFSLPHPSGNDGLCVVVLDLRYITGALEYRPGSARA